ncbi:hypothetical protein FRC07_014490 [Ceratobasidium sp. 392]|nr:hypothetical protein FRC07_014490 [Ceratobasidium sp. 392]
MDGPKSRHRWAVVAGSECPTCLRSQTDSIQEHNPNHGCAHIAHSAPTIRPSTPRGPTSGLIRHSKAHPRAKLPYSGRPKHHHDHDHLKSEHSSPPTNIHGSTPASSLELPRLADAPAGPALAHVAQASKFSNTVPRSTMHHGQPLQPPRPTPAGTQVPLRPVYSQVRPTVTMQGVPIVATPTGPAAILPVFSRFGYSVLQPPVGAIPRQGAQTVGAGARGVGAAQGDEIVGMANETPRVQSTGAFPLGRSTNPGSESSSTAEQTHPTTQGDAAEEPLRDALLYNLAGPAPMSTENAQGDPNNLLPPNYSSATPIQTHFLALRCDSLSNGSRRFTVVPASNVPVILANSHLHPVRFAPPNAPPPHQQSDNPVP